MDKLRILFACIPIPGNRFIIDLKTGLEKQGCEVDWDYEEFWKCKNDYDIIHIHWPEYLSFELESFLSETELIPQELWGRTKKCLDYWKSNSKIIYTRHVQYPHKRHDDELLKLYRMTTSYCNTVVHFANYSIQQFKEFYPEHTDVNHIVIPHHNYVSLPNKSTKEEARKILKIHHDAKVMLVFGVIKGNEKQLISEAFNSIKEKNKVLLAPGWKIQRRKFNYIRLREWVWEYEKWKASLSKKRRLNLGFIKEEDAHLYLNVADFLFIPRTNELNSGNITLGCTFGLVVVGKDSADIGEILKETGNPTFKVDNYISVKTAIEKALQLQIQNHGLNNRRIAMEQWNLEIISRHYVEAMRNALKK